MSLLFDAIPYLLALGSAALGVFSLLKDWRSYRHPTLRRAVAVVLCLVAALTVMRQFREDRDRRVEKQKQTEASKRLEGEVAAANAAQKENTGLFLESFTGLSQKVNDLQTQVKTDELQKKLAKVETELRATEKALAPGPRAKLVFTFAPVPDTDKLTPITDVTLPITSEGVVHIDFTLLNLTDVTASDGGFNLIVCSSCQYATEPGGFQKLPGQPETQRHIDFSQLPPSSVLGTIAVDMRIPDSISTFEIGVIYRCRTCVIERTTLKGTVHVRRPFVRQPVIPQKAKSGR